MNVKKLSIILGLGFISSGLFIFKCINGSCAKITFADIDYYIDRYVTSNYGLIDKNKYPDNYSNYIYSAPLNLRGKKPYYTKYPPFCYNCYNSSSYSAASKLKQKQRLRKIKRKMRNNITWQISRLSNNNSNSGTLTGYSVPIHKNILNNFSNKNYSNKSVRPITSSPTCNTDLWGKGSGSSSGSSGLFSKNSQTDNVSSGAKTGVTIIYD